MDDNRRQYQKQYREQYKSQAKRVNLTFSKDEYRAFLRAANSQGLKLSSYVKQMAFANFNNQAQIPTDLREELKTLRFAILNIANNVNQIAHHSNTIHALTTNDEHNLLQHLKQLDEVVESYIQGRILNTKGASHDH